MEDFGILAVGIVLLFVLILVGMWLPASVFWVPFAAFVTAKKAHEIGLSAAYFGLVGALYSSALLLPWIHLMFGLSGKRTHIAIIVIAYWGVSLIWLLSLLITHIFLGERNGMLAILTSLGSVVLMTTAIAQIVLRYGKPYVKRARPTGIIQYSHTLGDLWYIAPFWVTFAQALVLGWATWYAVFAQ